MPKLISGLRALIRAISCLSTLVSAGESPPPPYSFGQSGTVQPRSAIRSIQSFCASFLKTGLRPPQQASLSSRTGSRISGGQFASSQARVSARKVSRSAMSSPLRKRHLHRGEARRQSASQRIRPASAISRDSNSIALADSAKRISSLSSAGGPSAVQRAAMS